MSKRVDEGRDESVAIRVAGELAHAYNGDQCPDCVGATDAMTRVLQATSHIPEWHIRAKYVIADLWLRGFIVAPVKQPATPPHPGSDREGDME